MIANEVRGRRQAVYGCPLGGLGFFRGWGGTRVLSGPSCSQAPSGLAAAACEVCTKSEGRKEDANDRGVMEEVLEASLTVIEPEGYPCWACHSSTVK